MNKSEHTQHRFGVVVVIYGSGAQKVLGSYARIYEKLDLQGIPVVIVDHGGHDYLPNEFIRPNITYLSQKNHGFGSGVNLGCRKLFDSCEYAFVLNPDLDFSVDEIIQVGSKLSNPFYVLKVQEFGKDCSIFYYNRLTGVITNRPSSWGVPYFNGAAFCISKECFSLTGGFDESFFLYFEDVDFSLQLRRQGIPLEIIDTTSFVHEVGGSRTAGMNAFIQKAAACSGLRLVRKWFCLNLWLYIRYSLKWLLSEVRNPSSHSSKDRIEQ